MFSDTLLEKIRAAKRTSFTIDVNQLAVIIANLIFLHDIVVASEPLLIEAAAAVDLLPQTSFHARLAQYYRSHLEEERDHVKWVREDLKSAGVNVPAELPHKSAVAMAGSQYYLLKHTHPAALLGYMAVLEGDPTPIALVDLLEHAYGKELLRFIRIHAVKDPEHRKELCEVIDDTPESLRTLIAYSSENALSYIIQAAKTWGKAVGHKSSVKEQFNE